MAAAALVVLLVIAVAVCGCGFRADLPLDALVPRRQRPAHIVLLHGYGSNAEDWVQFVKTITLPAGRRV